MSKVGAVLLEIRDLLRANQPVKEVMTEEEAATYLNISRVFFRELVALYNVSHAWLRGPQTRGRKMFRKKDLDAFLETRLVGSPADASRLMDGRRIHLKGV